MIKIIFSLLHFLSNTHPSNEVSQDDILMGQDPLVLNMSNNKHNLNCKHVRGKNKTKQKNL